MTTRALKLCGTFLALMAAATANPSVSHAQSIIDQLTGAPGQGGDMFTQNMAILGLFVPHTDDCNATTEVFVQTGENNSSVAIGFCIDKDEHTAGAVHWEDARKECLEDGKRLPEPGEWKYACDSVAGLNNTTDDWEWASNYAQSLPGVSHVGGLLAPIAGNGSCDRSSYHHAGYGNSTAAKTYIFRCVR